MAATAMDPVDIANILAQELLYQQVTLHIADSIEYLYDFVFLFSMLHGMKLFFSIFLFYCPKKKIIIIVTLLHRKIVVITVILTIIYHKYTYNLSITSIHSVFFVYN